MEAYSQVHAPQELTEDQLWEEVESWVNSLLEEGYDLSEYTWGDMYETYLSEAGSPGAAIAATQQRQRQAQAQGAKQSLQQGKTLGVAGNFGFQSGTKVKMDSSATRQQGRTVVSSSTPTNRGPRGGTAQQRPNEISLAGQKMYAAKLGGKDVYVGARKPAAATTTPKPAATTTPKPAATTTPKPAATTTPKPTPSAAPKPAATTAPKPTTPAAKPAGSAMDQWAKANPKLAAAKAERDRTRGTSATTNPLMKDTKSSMPAPKAPAPSTAKTGFDLAKKGTNLAAGVDLFDIVKGHLLDEGYADSEEGAMVIMVNMSEGWKESILESCGVELELDESQYARENPEKYERSPEAREGRRRRSGINDPKTGINSPAFAAFMAQQMGGKKKKD